MVKEIERKAKEWERRAKIARANSARRVRLDAQLDQIVPARRRGLESQLSVSLQIARETDNYKLKGYHLRRAADLAKRLNGGSPADWASTTPRGVSVEIR